VIYPVIDNVDRDGVQLINRMAEIKRETCERNDRSQPGNLADAAPDVARLAVRLLDVAELIRNADQIRRTPLRRHDNLWPKARRRST
jgi:hypothetical protein